MKQLKVLNPENVSEEEVKTYDSRDTARAVVLDDDGNIAMLYVSNLNYYKIPGGGVEENEDRLEACKRECLEEIGSEVEVIGEVGIIVEYRKIFSLKQTSYCYLAKVKGEKGTPHYTDEELENGFKQIWVSYNEALKLLKESDAKDDEGRLYIVPRDIIFLEAAKEQLPHLL
jgi:ADP-ribose pyrophosphatase YjhB (NUDIX family)